MIKDSLSEIIILNILKCIESSKTPLTINEVIKTLKGSKSRIIFEKQLDKLKTYSSLKIISAKYLKKEIHSLIESEFILKKDNYGPFFNYDPYILLNAKAEELLKNPDNTDLLKVKNLFEE